MVIKKSFSEKIFDIINYLVLATLSLICIYPVVHVLAASFSMPSKLLTHQGPLIFPLGFTLKGYELVFNNPNIMLGYRNTLVYLVLGISLNIFMTAIGAYALSRRGTMLIRPLMLLITFTMYFSGGLIPWYLLLRNIGLTNNIGAMVIPGAVATYNLIVMRTSFMNVPASLEESARIDGANDLTILFRIFIPLSKAVLAVMLLFYGVGIWNSWFNASILLKDNELYPLQLVLRDILIMNDKSAMMDGAKSAAPENDQFSKLLQYSTIIAGTVPIFFIYPFLQKYFASGVMIGSLKE